MKAFWSTVITLTICDMALFRDCSKLQVEVHCHRSSAVYSDEHRCFLSIKGWGLMSLTRESNPSLRAWSISVKPSLRCHLLYQRKVSFTMERFICTWWNNNFDNIFEIYYYNVEKSSIPWEYNCFWIYRPDPLVYLPDRCIIYFEIAKE